MSSEASASSKPGEAPKSYVVEHMEDSDSLPPWVSLEYSHILSVVTPTGSKALFTNLSPVIQDALRQQCEGAQLQQHDFALRESIEDLIKSGAVSKDRVCLLDPKAPEVLAPADADQFDVFLFGGILGGWFFHFFCVVPERLFNICKQTTRHEIELPNSDNKATQDVI